MVASLGSSLRARDKQRGGEGVTSRRRDARRCGGAGGRVRRSARARRAARRNSAPEALVGEPEWVPERNRGAQFGRERHKIRFGRHARECQNARLFLGRLLLHRDGVAVCRGRRHRSRRGRRGLGRRSFGDRLLGRCSLLGRLDARVRQLLHDRRRNESAGGAAQQHEDDGAHLSWVPNDPTIRSSSMISDRFGHGPCSPASQNGLARALDACAYIPQHSTAARITHVPPPAAGRRARGLPRRRAVCPPRREVRFAVPLVDADSRQRSADVPSSARAGDRDC